MARAGNRIVVGFVFLVIALAAGTTAARLSYFAFSPAQSGSTTAVVLEVKKGQNPPELTRELVGVGVVSDGRYFGWLGKVTRAWKHVKAGEYQLSPGMTPLQIFSVITSGVSMKHPVTVREGENMYEIAGDISAKGLADRGRVLALCRDPAFIASLGVSGGLTGKVPSLEGYLFPDTYFFNRTMSAEDMLRQMVKHLASVWTPEYASRARELAMTEHQILTLASIIEKETGAPEERPIISSVFHNRLQKKMKLQSDPTTIYGMWDRFQGKIHKVDLSEKNDYNTYVIPALPIGPISNPGKESIQAALYPSQTDFLFFVSHNDGTHQFSRNMEEHERAVAKFQLDPKAREGKSWRDLTKKLGSKPKTRPSAQ